MHGGMPGRHVPSAGNRHWRGSGKGELGGWGEVVGSCAMRGGMNSRGQMSEEIEEGDGGYRRGIACVVGGRGA